MIRSRFHAALALVGLVFCASALAEDRMVFAVDVIRHGDRTPLYEIPAAPHQWAEGQGQLTARGVQQEYELGSRMRSAYVDHYHLLPSRYEAGTLYVRSRNMDRIIISAQSFLTGLYPHSTSSVTPDSGRAAPSDATQPIPIHVADNDDPLLNPDAPLYKHGELMARFVFPTEAWQAESSALRPQFAHWSQATGITIVNLQQLLPLGDTLFIDQIHDVSLPPELNEDDVQTIIEAGRWVMVAGFKPEQIGHITGHELLQAIAGYIETASRGNATLKYVLFSAHESTILSEMSALGAPLDFMPPYASHLNFALFQSERGDYSVKVSVNDRPTTIPGCGAAACSLPQFLVLSNQ